MSLNQSFKKILSLKLSYSPWMFFVLFMAADAFLAFSRMSLAVDLAVLLFGILVPFTIVLISLKKPVAVSGKYSFYQTEWFDIGPWFWIVLAILFIITRFYKLTTLPWPLTEDGYVAYFANRVATQGDWKTLYGCAQMEPLYIWGLAAWFKLFQSSLLALKTYSIILYVGVLVAGYWGTRQYFSKTISFVALWFLAFNFWAFFITRRCHASGALLFFACLVFYLLGASLLPPPHRRAKFFWLLALCIGIGFYSYTAWPVVAAMAVLPIFLQTKSEFPPAVKKLIAFILIPLILVLPLIHARLSAGGTIYIQGLLAGRPAGLDYLEALFWNGLRITRADPSNMGWLNPCLGALFLIGFLEVWRYRLFPWAKWVLWAFLIFLLPGILTNFFEIYRITADLPLICLLAALGFNAILSQFHFSKWKNIFIFFLLAFLSLGLDIYHYEGPGQLNDWNYWISNKRHFEFVDFSRAYPILETAHRNGTPLSIMIALNNNNNCDQTLNVVTTPFDNVSNLGALNHSDQKAALLVNGNYEPFLKKEFPDSEWTWLSPDLPSDYGGFMLGFIPINSSTVKILERWKKADDAFKRNNKILMDSVPDSADAGLKDLYAQYPIFHGDRFLESVFWDKVAYFEEYQNKIPEAVVALKNAAKDGYATAQFYSELGDLFAFNGYKKEAEGYFEKAIRCPVNRTTAVEKLKQLKSI
jgi:hypothetical protein